MKLKGLGNLIGLGIALLWLAVPTKTSGVQACIAARFNDYRDFGCRLPPDPWRDLSIPAYQARCNPCGGMASGMPVWWISQPYQNVWVADEPLSYPLSSGQQMSFRWTYRQRYNVPPVGAGRETSAYADMRTFGATNAAWCNNWFANIVYWDAPWETHYQQNHQAPPRAILQHEL